MWPCRQRSPSKQIRSRSVAATVARNRYGELPEQSALEESRASGYRFEQQGGELGVGARRGLKLGAIQFDDLRGAVGDGLLWLRRGDAEERPLSERTIAKETAAAQDQPDEAIAVDVRVDHLDVPPLHHPVPPLGIAE